MQEISTISLRDYLALLPASRLKEQLMDQLPYSSNYLIESSIVGKVLVGRVIDIDEKRHRPSNTSIRRHVQLADLQQK